MKKLFCLLLALSLFLPVAIFAEEAQDTDNNPVLPGDFPWVYFGSNPDNAIKCFDSGWRQFAAYASEPVEENITLANGAPFTILTYPAVTPESETSRGMTAKFYFRKGILIAAVQETVIPEGVDVSYTKNFVENGLKAGKAGRLRLEEIGINAELLGEAAHLQDGTDCWQYTFADGEKTTEAIITIQVVDGVLYVAEFMAEKNEELAKQKEITLSVSELKGYAELSGEQKNVVNMYAQYMMQQQKKMLEEYIEFVKNNK